MTLPHLFRFDPWLTGSGVLVGAVLLSLALEHAPVVSKVETEAKEEVGD